MIKKHIFARVCLIVVGCGIIRKIAKNTEKYYDAKIEESK